MHGGDVPNLILAACPHVACCWAPCIVLGRLGAKLKRRCCMRAAGVEPRCWHEPDYSWQEAEGAPLQGRTAQS